MLYVAVKIVGRMLGDDLVAFVFLARMESIRTVERCLTVGKYVDDNVQFNIA